MRAGALLCFSAASPAARTRGLLHSRCLRNGCRMDKWLELTMKHFISGSQVSFSQINVAYTITISNHFVPGAKTRAQRMRTYKRSLNLAKGQPHREKLRTEVLTTLRGLKV